MPDIDERLRDKNSERAFWKASKRWKSPGAGENRLRWVEGVAVEYVD